MRQEEGGKSGKALRREREMRRRAARSSLVQTLAAELEGAPMEVKHSVAEGESAFVRREAERLARRAAEEEDLFARVPMTKQEKKRAAAAANKKIGMAGQIADFGDDLADLMDAAQQIDTVRRGWFPSLGVSGSTALASAAVGAALRQPSCEAGAGVWISHAGWLLQMCVVAGAQGEPQAVGGGGGGHGQPAQRQEVEARGAPQHAEAVTQPAAGVQAPSQL